MRKQTIDAKRENMNKIPLVITSARSHAQTCIHPRVLTSYTGLQGPGHGKVRSEGVHSLGSAARAGRKAARGWKLRPGQSLGRSSPFALVLLEFSYLLTQIIANVNTYFNDLTEIGGACLTCCASSLLMGAQQDHSCEPASVHSGQTPRLWALRGPSAFLGKTVPSRVLSQVCRVLSNYMTHRLLLYRGDPHGAEATWIFIPLEMENRAGSRSCSLRLKTTG